MDRSNDSAGAFLVTVSQQGALTPQGRLILAKGTLMTITAMDERGPFQVLFLSPVTSALKVLSREWAETLVVPGYYQILYGRDPYWRIIQFDLKPPVGLPQETPYPGLSQEPGYIR